MKLIKSASAIAALVLSTNVNAALITESFTVTVENGVYSGAMGTGSFTYDNGLLLGVGEETINPVSGLIIEFNVFGQTFTEQNDVDYDTYPALSFFDGSVTGLDYIVSEISGITLTNINQEGVYGFLINGLTAVEGGYEGLLVVDDIGTVPVPAAAWLFGSGLIGLLGITKRRARV